MTKLSRMEVPPPPEVLRQDGVVVEEADAKNRGILRARRRHPLEDLRTRGSVTREQFDAGMEFFGDFLMSAVAPSASQYDGVKPPDAYHPRTPPLAPKRVGARVKVAQAMKYLGPRLSAVVVVVCGEGHTVSEFASRRGMSPHQATGYLIAALDRLSEYYGA